MNKRLSTTIRAVETKKYTFDRNTTQKRKRVLLALPFVHVIAERTFTNVTSLIDANIESLHPVQADFVTWFVPKIGVVLFFKKTMKVQLLQEIRKHFQKILGLSFVYGTFKLAYPIVRGGEVISYVDLLFKTLEYAFVMPINYAVDCTMLAICLAPKMLLGEKESVNYLMDHIRLGPYNIGNHP